jgi:Derlin-2/3
MFIGNPIETDLLGIVVGHVYYFLEFVYPHLARVRGWRRQKLLVTPRFLHYLCGSRRGDNGGGGAEPEVVIEVADHGGHLHQD